MMDRQAPLEAREKWVALGAVAVLMALVIRNAWVTEDAYITLRTVDNLLNGHGLRWNVAERVQSYTHPLWMVLLTVSYALVGDGYFAALLLGVCMTLLACLALIHLSRSGGHALVAVVAVALSRSFVDYSTAGLENPLSHLLTALLVYCYAVRRAGTLPVALCGAALALNRSDSLLIALLPLAHTLWRDVRAIGFAQTAKQLVLGFSPLLAWEAWSLFYYGFLVPNTAFAKLNTGVERDELVGQGIAYVTNSIAWDPGLLLPLGLGFGACAIRREPRMVVLALSALLYFGFVVRIGGDFMQGRFFTLPIFLCACLVAITPLALTDAPKVVAVLAPLLLFAFHPAAQNLKHFDAGIADERAFYEDGLTLAQYSRDRGLPAHAWRDVGTTFAAQVELAPVRSSYNVGMIGFYAGPKVHLIDENALGDPLLARLPARYVQRWRIGHYTRQLPEGYSETIRSGACVMSDRSLCDYYAKLKEIVSGDLWSWSRFRTIFAMNSGHYDSYIDFDRYRYPDLAREPVAKLTAPIPEDSAWDNPGARIIGADGIEILLEKPTRAKALSISFDGNDQYEIEFRLGPEKLDQLTALPVYRPGMHTRIVAVPTEALKRGFDRVRVRPIAGDGMYSLGNVRVSP